MAYTPSWVVATWVGNTVGAENRQGPMNDIFGTTGPGKYIDEPFIDSLPRPAPFRAGGRRPAHDHPDPIAVGDPVAVPHAHAQPQRLPVSAAHPQPAPAQLAEPQLRADSRGDRCGHPGGGDPG